jgi:hypothetical protein
MNGYNAAKRFIDIINKKQPVESFLTNEETVELMNRVRLYPSTTVNFFNDVAVNLVKILKEQDVEPNDIITAMTFLQSAIVLNMTMIIVANTGTTEQPSVADWLNIFGKLDFKMDNKTLI